MKDSNRAFAIVPEEQALHYRPYSKCKLNYRKIQNVSVNLGPESHLLSANGKKFGPSEMYLMSIMCQLLI